MASYNLVMFKIELLDGEKEALRVVGFIFKGVAFVLVAATSLGIGLLILRQIIRFLLS